MMEKLNRLEYNNSNNLQSSDNKDNLYNFEKLYHKLVDYKKFIDNIKRNNFYNDKYLKMIISNFEGYKCSIFDNVNYYYYYTNDYDINKEIIRYENLIEKIKKNEVDNKIKY